RHVLTHTVRDSAAVLDIIQGYMTGDWYTAPAPSRPYLQEVGVDPGRLRIGVRTTAPGGLAELDPACTAAVDDAAALLESLGHEIVENSPAALDEMTLLEAFMPIMLASIQTHVHELETLAGRPITPDDIEPMMWNYYEAGKGLDAAGYLAALDTAHAWTRRLTSWWLADGFDLLLTPTCAEPPPLIGDLGDQSDGGVRAGARALPFAIFTAPFNVSGQPAMSVPLFWSDANLPVGVQLAAAPFREDVLIRVASQLEAARPWADRRPPLYA
ncbi:MAG TPA: amidase family protein, partial [Acidimicrobiia bacterium]|nr:amidase family protein [Acidimicrobiia bacterium]